MEVLVSVTYLVTNPCLELPPQSMSQLQSLLPAFNISNQLKWPYSYLSNTYFSSAGNLFEDKIRLVGFGQLMPIYFTGYPNTNSKYRPSILP